VTTLIALYTSDGCVGRCDAKCYDAAQPECDCICQGANHGAGKRLAIDNTRAWAETWIDHARQNGQDLRRAETGLPVTCTPLFGEE
jgi:hypothetical protein